MQYISLTIATKFNNRYIQYFIILIKVNNCRHIVIVNFDTINNLIIKTLIKREEYFI